MNVNLCLHKWVSMYVTMYSLESFESHLDQFQVGTGKARKRNDSSPQGIDHYWTAMSDLQQSYTEERRPADEVQSVSLMPCMSCSIYNKHTQL